MTEIWTALIGLAGVIITAGVGYRRVAHEKKVVKLAKAELGDRSTALSFHGFLGEWNEIHQELSDLIATTGVDRFLLFRAWNGELAPLWTTAIFQFRDGEQKPVSYVNFELDEDYVDRLRMMIQRGSVALLVKDLPPSAIRDVYQAEGVSSSVWFHVDSHVMENSKSKAITYCSFATHNDKPLCQDDITKCRILVGRLKGLARESLA